MTLTQVLTVVRSGGTAAIDRQTAVGELSSPANDDQCEVTRAALPSTWMTCRCLR